MYNIQACTCTREVGVPILPPPPPAAFFFFIFWGGGRLEIQEIHVPVCPSLPL